MNREQHWDVASYALGVLDATDSERFEAHLATCWVCAGELESFLPVVGALAEVNGADLAVTEQVDRQGALLRKVMTAVGDDRRRARHRRVLSIAAGVVLIVLLSGFALFAGSRWVARPDVVAGPTASAPAPGLGTGEVRRVTDPGTQVHAEMVAESKLFGTRIGLELSQLRGPATCRLVVLHKNGTEEVVSSWRVPEGGYGTPERPDPLVLQSATAGTLADISAVQVQVRDPDGGNSPLVTVRM